MTNLAIIENKISAVKKYLKILEDFKKYPLKELENDLNIRGAVERYLYLATQATIELGEAVIAFKNLRKPTTLSETFSILTEEKIITSSLKEKMIKMTGFRNIMAHDYEKINYDIVYEVLHHRLKDIEEFIKTVKKII